MRVIHKREAIFGYQAMAYRFHPRVLVVTDDTEDLQLDMVPALFKDVTQWTLNRV